MATNWLDQNEAFNDGWERWVEHTSYANLYWRAAQNAWQTFDPAANTVTALDVPALLVYSWMVPTLVWPNVKRSWEGIKLNHPDALWSPHSGRWNDHAAKPSKTFPPHTDAAAAALTQRLQEIEELYRTHQIDAVTRLQLRTEALRDYEEQSSNSLP